MTGTFYRRHNTIDINLSHYYDNVFQPNMLISRPIKL